MAASPLGFQCIYECSDQRSVNGDGEDGSEISGGGERVNITCLLVSR